MQKMKVTATSNSKLLREKKKSKYNDKVTSSPKPCCNMLIYKTFIIVCVSSVNVV